MTLDEAIKHAEEKSDCSKCGQEHQQLADWLKELKLLKNSFPRPIIRDSSGKLIKDYNSSEFYSTLQKKLFNVVVMYQSQFDFMNNFDFDIDDESLFPKAATNVVDIISLCLAYLSALGYRDMKSQLELFRQVNEKNEKSGLLESEEL